MYTDFPASAVSEVALTHKADDIEIRDIDSEPDQKEKSGGMDISFDHRVDFFTRYHLNDAENDPTAIQGR